MVSHLVDLKMQMQPLYRSIDLRLSPSGPPNSCIPYTRTLDPTNPPANTARCDAQPPAAAKPADHESHAFLAFFLVKKRYLDLEQ